MPGYRVWEGLPLNAALVMSAMECHWPYAEGTRATVRRWTADWTAEDQRLFEQRFTNWLDNGVHWD